VRIVPLPRRGIAALMRASLIQPRGGSCHAQRSGKRAVVTNHVYPPPLLDPRPAKNSDRRWPALIAAGAVGGIVAAVIAAVITSETHHKTTDLANPSATVTVTVPAPTPTTPAPLPVATAANLW
jgi:hypothetical protein